MDKLLQSFVCLIKKLEFVPENVPTCRTVGRKYKPILIGTNVEKKNDIGELVKKVLAPLWEEHMGDICNKEFGFINDTNMIILDTNIGELYVNALDHDDSSSLILVNNELLFMFYHIMDKDKQEEIAKRFAKKPKDVPVPTAKGVQAAISGQKTLSDDLHGILNKYQHDLKKAEGNSALIGPTLTKIFKNDSDAMVGMLQNVMGSLGVDEMVKNSK